MAVDIPVARCTDGRCTAQVAMLMPKHTNNTLTPVRAFPSRRSVGAETMPPSTR